jgi:hypothetical protein
MTHRHYGVPVAKPRPTYTGETRAAALSGGSEAQARGARRPQDQGECVQAQVRGIEKVKAEWGDDLHRPQPRKTRPGRRMSTFMISLRPATTKTKQTAAEFDRIISGRDGR